MWPEPAGDAVQRHDKSGPASGVLLRDQTPHERATGSLLVEHAQWERLPSPLGNLYPLKGSRLLLVEAQYTSVQPVHLVRQSDRDRQGAYADSRTHHSNRCHVASSLSAGASWSRGAIQGHPAARDSERSHVARRCGVCRPRAVPILHGPTEASARSPRIALDAGHSGVVRVWKAWNDLCWHGRVL